MPLARCFSGQLQRITAVCVLRAPEELPLVPTDSSFPLAPAIESRPPYPSATPRGLFEAAPRRSACVALTASGTQAAGRNIQPACEVSEKGSGG